MRGCVDSKQCETSAQNLEILISRISRNLSVNDIPVNVRLCGQCKIDAPHLGSQFPNVPNKDLNVSVFVRKYANFPILSFSAIPQLTLMKISMVRKDGQHLSWKEEAICYSDFWPNYFLISPHVSRTGHPPCFR